jgi:hypothetical protein
MLAIALILAAQLSGTIVSDGMPLPGCTVTVERPDIVRRAVTDADGHYRFHALPPGPYELTVELPGLETIHHPVFLGESDVELPPEEMAVDPALQQITITVICTLGACSDTPPRTRWDPPTCVEIDENSRLIEAGDPVELRRRYDTTFTLTERHRIGGALLGRIDDDRAIRRELEEYAALASGSTVTRELEAWCLERRLDPLNVLAVADHARRALSENARFVRAQLTGRVTLETAPLPGCAISLAAAQFERHTVSSEDGSYAFDSVPAGTYELAFELAGLDTVRRTITLHAGANTLPAQAMRVTPFPYIVTVEPPHR